jgi:hypothetical protein
VVPLDASSGLASPTLALSAQTEVQLDASAGAADASLSLSAQTVVELDASLGESSASLTVTAPTGILLDASSGASSATLSLTAPTRVQPASSALGGFYFGQVPFGGTLTEPLPAGQITLGQLPGSQAPPWRSQSRPRSR